MVKVDPSLTDVITNTKQAIENTLEWKLKAVGSRRDFRCDALSGDDRVTELKCIADTLLPFYARFCDIIVPPKLELMLPTQRSLGCVLKDVVHVHPTPARHIQSSPGTITQYILRPLGTLDLTC
jgi:hypothetical protein